MNRDRPYSPSQLETFLKCQRKWAWNYIVQVPKAENESARFGTVSHGHMADWFLYGTVPPETPEGKAALAALPMWPAPRAGMHIETAISCEVDGWYYHGFQDIGYDNVVGDHKFTSDHKWAKSAEVLLRDPQAQIYALAEMQRTGVPEVTLRWVYTTMKRPRPKLVTTIVTRAQAEKFVREELNPVAKEIHRLYLVKDLNPNDLPPTVSHCSAYGGCPHVGRCNLTAQQKFEGAIMEQSMAERLEAMVAKQKGAATALNPPAPTVAAPTVAAPTVAASKLMDLIAAKVNVAPTTVTLTPAQAPAPTVADVLVPVLEVPAPTVKAAKGRHTAEKGFTLLIDATYGKGGSMPLYANSLIDKAREALLALGISDYRTVDFGKGPGMLADQVRKLLPTIPDGVTVVVDTMSRPELDVVDVLIGAAATVIRAA